MIPHSKPWITPADLEAVGRALESGMIGAGARVEALEMSMAAWVGADGGVATGSGSAAVVLALEGLGVGSGDEVVVPTYVCVSVLEAVVAVGAQPVLCDVGPDWVVTPADVEPVITARTRALIVPHMHGIFADVAAFRVFDRPILEDCAQAIGASGGHPMRGDVAIFSFHPTKCLTTGEGGMAVGDARIVARMRARRDGTGTGAGRLFSPMADTAAALGLSQLARYDQALARRQQQAQSYIEALAAVAPGALPQPRSGGTMHFRFPLRVPGGLESVAEQFASHGVTVRRGVNVLLHRMTGRDDRAFATACRLLDTTVMLPIYPALSEAEHRRCREAAVSILPAATAAAG